MKHLIIPSEMDGHKVTSIEAHAFYNHWNLDSIQLPDTVTKLDDYAFMNCRGISSIVLPDSIVEVWGNPFSNIDIHFSVSQNHPYLQEVDGTLVSKPDKRIIYIPINVESYDISDDIVIIGNGAFYGCKRLKEIEISNGVSSIDSYVFYECARLNRVVIPESIKNIGDYAFFGYIELSEITEE